MTCACQTGGPWGHSRHSQSSVRGCSHAETRSQKSASIRATATRRINSGETHRRGRCGPKFVAQQDPSPPLICRSRGKRPGSGAQGRHCLSLPVVSVVKEPLPQAGGPWGHSFYVLSVTYRKRKFKMVLSKCCQKNGKKTSRLSPYFHSVHGL